MARFSVGHFNNKEQTLTTKTTPAAITPAIAATQAAWHAKQAAEYYAQSLLMMKSPQARATARKRFMTDARLALPVMGLDEFLRHFKAWLDAADTVFEDAKATVLALAAAAAKMASPPKL